MNITEYREFKNQPWIKWLFAAEMAVCEHDELEIIQTPDFDGPITHVYCHKCGYCETYIN